MKNHKISVIGLGYVGIPLCVALARYSPVVGFDIKSERVSQLKKGWDATGEVDTEDLRASSLVLTDTLEDVAGSDVFIITVPTPVDADNRPDLSAIRSACEMVGGVMSKGAIVVLESTVYPGVTEDFCGPILENVSGLVCGYDFFLGYSPERVNPGDRENTVERIAKVVAGQNEQVTETLAEMYGAITTGGIFRARDIRTAEAAKVIENAQRDINIAFVNEVTQIFQKTGLSIFDVLEAASTKWNFLGFQPGLVGGHCIGIDPFYLARWAQDNGYEPEIILAGRRINDGMGAFVADQIDRMLEEISHGGDEGKGDILILGLTFKEDVPDLRNSRVIDVVERLRELGYGVQVHDPLADPVEARQFYDIELLESPEPSGEYTCVIGAVAHRAYREFSTASLANLLRPGGLVADVKGMWRGLELPDGLRRWQL
ncbi:MAG: nucleotide sugar dehydrogenase [Rhodospirillales bacterium]|nr:nucleotide sugar dehydrogenase [Rhodospirillales bacterium]